MQVWAGTGLGGSGGGGDPVAAVADSDAPKVSNARHDQTTTRIGLGPRHDEVRVAGMGRDGVTTRFCGISKLARVRTGSQDHFTLILVV